MKNILILAAGCVVTLSLISNIGLAQEKIVISGTGDSQELLRIMADAFEKANPGTEVEVPDSVGSKGGIKAVIEGKSDLARIARLISDDEKADNLNCKVFAYSPVVFAVNPSVKGINSLTFEQILAIFSGKIISWSELGGEKQKIYAIQRESGDSCRTILEKNIPGWDSIEESPAQIIYSTPETISTMIKYDNTIGYAPLSMVKRTGLTVIQIADIYPSAENVKNGNYKLIIPFGIVWKGEFKGLAKAFVDFILSTEGQKIIAENGAVPVI